MFVKVCSFEGCFWCPSVHGYEVYEVPHCDALVLVHLLQN